MTPEYLYTLDLGETYGRKLEQLAAMASYDDVEAFAAMLLRDAIDRLVADMKKGDAAEAGPLDDGPIPF